MRSPRRLAAGSPKNWGLGRIGRLPTGLMGRLVPRSAVYVMRGQGRRRSVSLLCRARAQAKR